MPFRCLKVCLGAFAGGGMDAVDAWLSVFGGYRTCGAVFGRAEAGGIMSRRP